MPISLNKIANNLANVSFPYDSETIHLEYYPGRITEKVFAQLQSFSHMDENNIIAEFAAFNAILVNLIKSWDVYEDDEQQTMFPLDADRLAELPVAFRGACILAITEDMRPNQTAPTQN